jgi:hypothetical protein
VEKSKNDENWQTRKDAQCFVDSPKAARHFRQLRSSTESSRSIVVLQNCGIYCLVLVLLLQCTVRKTLKIQTSTMILSSLNVDVLLHLMEFVKPDDRFNLVLSGILKGFESVVKGIDLRKRYLVCFTFVSSGNQIVVCPGSNIVKLNWGHVVIARAN